jgi:hypothetical protein
MDAAAILYRIYIKLNVYPNSANFQLIVGDIGSSVLYSTFTSLLNLV